MLRKHVYPHLKKSLEAASHKLNSFNVKPDHLTLLGVFFSLLTGITIGIYHNWFLACMLGLISGFLDLLDGSLSRTCNLGSKFGAFFDSTMDRFADFFIFGGVLFHYVQMDNISAVFVCILVLIGSSVTSYSRARMEALGVECKAGFMERGERLVILGIAALFPVIMIFALWTIAILSNFTAIQRILYAKSELTREA